MKKVFTILMLMQGCTFSEISTKMSNYTVDEQFIDYKTYTINKLREHSIRHPNCILEHLKIEELYIQSKKLYNTRFEGEVLAYCFPDELDNTMYVKRNYKWKEKKAFITIIHEALHIRFICKPDTVYTGQSVCKLWNVDAYTSQDITNILEAHLHKELNK